MSVLEASVDEELCKLWRKRRLSGVQDLVGDVCYAQLWDFV